MDWKPNRGEKRYIQACRLGYVRGIKTEAFFVESSLCSGLLLERVNRSLSSSSRGAQLALAIECFASISRTLLGRPLTELFQQSRASIIAY